MRAFPFFPLSEPGAHTCVGADVGFGCWHFFPVWVVIRRPVFFLFTLEACGRSVVSAMVGMLMALSFGGFGRGLFCHSLGNIGYNGGLQWRYSSAPDGEVSDK